MPKLVIQRQGSIVQHNYYCERCQPPRSDQRKAREVSLGSSESHRCAGCGTNIKGGAGRSG